MTVGPAHIYISEGLSKGLEQAKLLEIHRASTKLKRKHQTYLHSLAHLAHCSGVRYEYLRRVILREVEPYETFAVRKRKGGHRFISTPDQPLMTVQRWINKFILSSIKPHWRCYSYRPDTSILHAAREHCSTKWLIKIDIENFFGSISEAKVYQFFYDLGYNSLLSFELSRLCTFPKHGSIPIRKGKSKLYNRSSESFPYSREEIEDIGVVPQGAPTSPSISNLVFREIDKKFEGFADAHKLVYTRYADDICFSSQSTHFSREDAVQVIRYCSKILKKHGYLTKKIKEKIIPPGVPKIVLGLNVDHDEPKLSRAFKKRLSLHLRGISKFGIIEHAQHKSFNSAFALIEHIRGLTNHAAAIERDYGTKMRHLLISEIRKQGFS